MNSKEVRNVVASVLAKLRTICHGDPVIWGTRILVRIVVGSLAAGMPQEEVQREYDLTAEDIQAAAEAFWASRPAGNA